MENQIIKVEPKDFGIDDNRAAQVKAFFMPMLEKMETLEIELNEVKASTIPEITPSVCKQARELRLKYKDVRIGTEKIHKELKAFYLNGGRFIDSWKNAQKSASEGREQELDKIERHFELIEAGRKAKLESDRWSLLCSFVDPFVPKETYNLAGMTEEVFTNFLTGAKENHALKKAAEQKAIDDRKKEEHAEQIRQMQLKIENERLRKEREEFERQNQEKEARLREQEKYQREVTDRLNAEREKTIRLEKEKREREEQDAKDIEKYNGETFIKDKSPNMVIKEMDMDDVTILNEILYRVVKLFVGLPKFKNTKLDVEIDAVHRKVKEFIEMLIKENQ